MSPSVRIPAMSGPPGTILKQETPGGFLCAEYAQSGMLANIWAARTTDGPAIGRQVFVVEDRYLSFKTRDGLAGIAFNDGYVTFGTVWDDDDGPREPPPRIGRDEFLGDCLDQMLTALQDVEERP